jgi:hypothetical protein
MKKLKKPIPDDVRTVTDQKAPSLRETPMELLTEVRREEALT